MTDATVDSSDYAEKLLLEEYKAIREDQHISWDAARSTVTRGLSATGVLLAAALVGAGKALELPARGFLDVSVLSVLAVLTPGVVMASAVVWLGEVIRAERASLQLVRFEKAMAGYPLSNGRALGYFHAASVEDPDEGEQSASTIGIVITFAATALIPYVLGGAWVYARDGWGDGQFIAAITVGALVVIAGGASAVHLSTRVVALRNKIHAEARPQETAPIA